MLQGLVRFVGFYGAALVAVFLRAVFPLLHIEFELLAFFLAAWRMALFGGGNFRARAAKFGVRLADAFRKCFQFRAQRGNLVVDTLQLDQVGNSGMHG